MFVGIPLPSELQDKIEKWQKNYQNRFSPEGIRWMKKGNLHITLLPPWEETDISKIINKLQHNIDARESFFVNFQNILFIPKGKAKYLWVTGEAPKELLQLREAIATHMQKTVEQRPFRLHTTIARLNKTATVTDIEENVDWQFSVHSFALLQSQLLSTGAEYKVLATFPLL